MAGEAGKKIKSKSVSNNPEGDPNPNGGSDMPLTKTEKRTKKDKDRKQTKELSELDKTILKFRKGNREYIEAGRRNFEKKHTTLMDLYRDYEQYLSESEKEKLKAKMVEKINKFDIRGEGNISIHEFWKNQKRGDNNESKWANGIMQIFEQNSKIIQEQLGGKKSEMSRLFRKNLDLFKSEIAKSHREKQTIVNKHLSDSVNMDKILEQEGIKLASVTDLLIKER
jgi:hypothetical protein